MRKEAGVRTRASGSNRRCGSDAAAAFARGFVRRSGRRWGLRGRVAGGNNGTCWRGCLCSVDTWSGRLAWGEFMVGGPAQDRGLVWVGSERGLDKTGRRVMKLHQGL